MLPDPPNSTRTIVPKVYALTLPSSEIELASRTHVAYSSDRCALFEGRPHNAWQHPNRPIADRRFDAACVSQAASSRPRRACDLAVSARLRSFRKPAAPRRRIDPKVPLA